MITNAQIKKIKTLQRICCLDDEIYRSILRSKAGVNSSKELRSKRQIDAVISHLNNLAEKIEKQAKRKAENWKWEEMPEGKILLEKAGKIAIRPGRPSLDQFQYIFGLWWELRNEWKNSSEKSMEPTLNHFLENGRGGSDLKVANWQWLTFEKAHQLINVLKGRTTSAGKKKKPTASH
ncbi:MAG: hypothetical protein ACD_15C00093G0004 [uncultured bacterium]|nr:MAG: hypothetical protein ACD_15C00093G0004 [uncultured bacterium]